MTTTAATTPAKTKTTTTTDPARHFSVRAMPTGLLEHVRAGAGDASGNRAEHVVAAGGEPLRCCLRDARAGERLILFGYAPPIPAGPYAERGAVYAHEHLCPGPATDDYPAGWRGRPQVLRAYDARGWIRDARVHDGEQPEAVIARLLADPEVAQVHSRNVAYGCFMFQVVRTP